MQGPARGQRESNASVFVVLRALRLEIVTVVRLAVDGELHKQPPTGHRLYTNHRFQR